MTYYSYYSLFLGFLHARGLAYNTTLLKVVCLHHHRAYLRVRGGACDSTFHGERNRRLKFCNLVEKMQCIIDHHDQLPWFSAEVFILRECVDFPQDAEIHCTNPNY